MAPRSHVIACSLLLAVSGLFAQQNWTGARFGEVIPLGGAPQDIVLDELRGLIYAVNSSANRIDIYNYREKKSAGSIRVGTYPVGAAMDMDNAYLYVTNVQSATLNVIDLGGGTGMQTISLPAKPEGIAVGIDRRVLITTQGSGTNNANNQLLIFDPTQQQGQQLTPVLVAPPITTPTPLPPVTIGRPATAFPGRLLRTPDGNFIIGMVAINQTLTSAQTTLFVYEVSSGVVLKNRTVTGQSTILALSPDASRLMAGSTLYDTATLSVLGQLSTSNLPFFTGTGSSSAFNIQQNSGGSVFTPDDQTLYGAFNVAPTATPPQRPQATVLYVCNPRNLGVRLGIKLPESIAGKMVLTEKGDDAWAISESGLLHLPLSTLYDNPIIWPETTQVFLAVDNCNKGVAHGTLNVANLGKGKLTFSVPSTSLGTALVAQQSSGLAPATITFSMEPGRAGVIRQPGTNLYTGTGAAGGTGVPFNVVLASQEAINIPNAIRVYMNYRLADQRGIIYPVPTTLTASEGLQDLVLDEARGKLYVTNSGFNQIEVFDLQKQHFVQPIEVGQLPHQMAMTVEGNRLYVGNTGGESISIIDLTLDQPKVVAQVEFPPIPRSGTVAPIFPRTMAMGLSGLQFIMSNGTAWELIANQAVPRQASTVIGVDTSGRQCTLSSPQQMISTSGGEYVILLGGPAAGTCSIAAGTAFLFDSLLDDFTTSRQLYTQQPIVSYYGPLATGPQGSYFLVGGLVVNSALSVIGGSESPSATQTSLGASQRNVAAVYALDENTFVRLTTPVRTSPTATTQGESRTTLEMVDLRTGSQSVVGVTPENPVSLVTGQTRVQVPPRQLVVDSQGNAYAITLSGLSVITLAASDASSRPQLAAGASGIINSTDGTPNFHPGSFVTVKGTNLAASATADTIPLPSVLGGSCVVFNDVPLPLLQTSGSAIFAQVPADLSPGMGVLQVRSLATAQSSDPVVVTIQKP